MAENFIRFCISHIVSQPEAVSLEVREDEDATRYQLTVHTDDMKRVIGRSGKTIRALQSLVRVIGIKQSKKLFLNLVEPCSPQ
ncbi:MAG: KH domain-containing protein [Candidatus Gracilibacteria bacterium]